MPASKNAPIGPQHIETVRMLLEHQESDRGCVIYGTALLEDQLESLLRVCCRKEPSSAAKVVDSLFQTYAPFSTFSAKIQVSYALGLIPEELYKQLLLLKKLRNDFAHDKTAVSFQSTKYQHRLQAILDGLRSYEPPIDSYLAEFDKVVVGDRVSKAQLMKRFEFCLCVFTASALIRVAQKFAPLNLGRFQERLERAGKKTDARQ